MLQTMCVSDWSSVVWSSDLSVTVPCTVKSALMDTGVLMVKVLLLVSAARMTVFTSNARTRIIAEEIGRASCRERVKVRADGVRVDEKFVKFAPPSVDKATIW